MSEKLIGPSDMYVDTSCYSFTHLIDDAMKCLVFRRFGKFFQLRDQNRDLVFQPKAIVQRKIAEKRGQASVEFLSLWRNKITPDWERQRTSVARNGIDVRYTNSNETYFVNIKAVPVQMDYELRFWSKDYNSITLAVESYMKWFQDFPNLVIYYQGLYKMEMYMKFGPWTDETDYDIYEKGLYYVSSMPISLDGWVMTSITVPTVTEIIVDLYIRNAYLGQTQDIFVSEQIITATPSGYSGYSGWSGYSGCSGYSGHHHHCSGWSGYSGHSCYS